jgi:hypothetical protein
VNQHSRHIPVINTTNSVTGSVTTANEVFTASQDHFTANFDEMSSVFTTMEREIRMIHAAYEAMKMQLAEIRRVARVMEDEKNAEISNLREQLQSLQNHPYPQSMSSYPPVVSYPSFGGQIFPNYHSRPYRGPVSVQSVGQPDFASSHPPIQSNFQLYDDRNQERKGFEIHSYSNGPQFSQTFPSNPSTKDFTALTNPPASENELPYIPAAHHFSHPTPRPTTPHSPTPRPTTPRPTTPRSPTPDSPTPRHTTPHSPTPRPTTPRSPAPSPTSPRPEYHSPLQKQPARPSTNDGTPPMSPPILRETLLQDPPVVGPATIDQDPAIVQQDQVSQGIESNTKILEAKLGDIPIDPSSEDADIKAGEIANVQQGVENEEDGRVDDLTSAQKRAAALTVKREMKAKRHAKWLLNLKKDKSDVATQSQSSSETPLLTKDVETTAAGATAAQQVSRPFALFNAINSRTDDPLGDPNFDLSFLDSHRDMFRNFSYGSDDE